VRRRVVRRRTTGDRWREGECLRVVGVVDAGLTGDLMIVRFETVAGLDDDHEVLDGVFGSVCGSHGG
jgi:hypothetical protein